jgi:acetyltransferase EpsM
MKHNQNTRIVVIGAVGTALNIVEQIADASNNHAAPVKIEGIIIDTLEQGTSVAGFPVLGGLNRIPELLARDEISFIFAMYRPDLLKERYQLMTSLGIPQHRYATFIHPKTFVAASVKMGRGNVILSNSTINSNVTIGNMNIISSNVSIEHDTVIGNGNFFAAGSVAGARVKVGNHCFTGINASLREDVVIDELFVGMHSLVLNSYSHCTVAGVPALILKRSN